MLVNKTRKNSPHLRYTEQWFREKTSKSTRSVKIKQNLDEDERGRSSAPHRVKAPHFEKILTSTSKIENKISNTDHVSNLKSTLEEYRKTVKEEDEYFIDMKQIHQIKDAKHIQRNIQSTFKGSISQARGRKIKREIFSDVENLLEVRDDLNILAPEQHNHHQDKQISKKNPQQQFFKKNEELIQIIQKNIDQIFENQVSCFFQSIQKKIDKRFTQLQHKIADSSSSRIVEFMNKIENKTAQFEKFILNKMKKIQQEVQALKEIDTERSLAQNEEIKLQLDEHLSYLNEVIEKFQQERTASERIYQQARIYNTEEIEEKIQTLNNRFINSELRFDQKLAQFHEKSSFSFTELHSKIKNLAQKSQQNIKKIQSQVDRLDPLEQKIILISEKVDEILPQKIAAVIENYNNNFDIVWRNLSSLCQGKNG